MLRALGVALALTLVSGAVQAQTTVQKDPDQGTFWNPLSPSTGSYAYADCFIAPAGTDVFPQSLGMWLDVSVPPPPSVRFEIWGDAAGPDAASIVATTGSMSPSPAGLTFFSAPVQASALALVPGTQYWFVATVVGESGTGSFAVGGHTQNSQQSDNCTFWYSNDPAGVTFDGQNLTPEMAFSVSLDDTPVPVELLSFSVGD